MVLAAKEEARRPSPQLAPYTYRAYRYDVFEVEHSPTMATHFLEEVRVCMRASVRFRVS